MMKGISVSIIINKSKIIKLTLQMPESQSLSFSHLLHFLSYQRRNISTNLASKTGKILLCTRPHRSHHPSRICSLYRGKQYISYPISKKKSVLILQTACDKIYLAQFRIAVAVVFALTAISTARNTSQVLQIS